MKKKLILSILFIFAVIFLIIGVSAIHYYVDENGNIKTDETEKNPLDSVTKQNIKNIVDYFKSTNSPLLDETITVDENGMIIIESPLLATAYGKYELLRVPKGFKIEKTSEGIVLKGFSQTIIKTEFNDIDVRTSKEGTSRIEKSERPSLEILGFKIDISKDSKVSFSEDKSGNRILTIDGEADFVSTLKNQLVSIKKANLKIDKNGNIVFADFVSTKGGVYDFEYNGKKFGFVSQKNGHIVFNPFEKEIKGENTKLVFDDNSKIDSFKGFSVKLDENGNAIEIELSETDKYTKNGIPYSSTKGSLKIYLDGRDVRGLEENAVSFDKNGLSKLKGFVKISVEQITYKGKSADAYTEFNPSYKREDGKIFPFFDVKQGLASINNARNIVEIENGKAKLERKKGAYESSSFGFAVYSNGERVEGFLDEAGNDYSLIAYKKDGKTITSAMDYSKWSNELIESASKRKISVDEYLQGSIDKLAKKIEELKANNGDKKQIDALELAMISFQKQLKDFYKEPNEDIVEILRNFIRDDKAPEIKASASVLLAEMLVNQDQKKSSNEFVLEYLFPSGKDTVSRSAVTLVFDKDGKVKGYDYNGKRYGLFSDSGIKEVDRIMANALDYIKKNPSIDDVVNYAKENKMSFSGASSIDEFKSSLARAKEIRDLTDYITAYAEENKDSGMGITARLMDAQAYKEFGDYETALDVYKGIIEGSSNKEIQSEAYRLRAMAEIEQNPGKNLRTALQELGKSLEINPENSKARDDLKKIQASLAGKTVELTNDEPQKISQDLFGIIGEGTGNEVFDRIRQALFHPVSSYYYQFSGRAEDLVQTEITKLSENGFKKMGAQAVKSLIENGYDTQKFLNMPMEEKFKTIAEMYRYDRTISMDELRGYLKESGANIFNSESKQPELEKLFKVIEEKRGASVANEYRNHYNSAILTIESIDFAVRNDPRIYLIAGNGEKIPGIDYAGDEKDLDNAFTLTRAGKPIEMNWWEVGLMAPDFVASMVGLGGAGRFIGIGAEAIGIGRVVRGTATIFSPGEAIVLKTLGEEVPFITKLVVGGVADYVSWFAYMGVGDQISPEFKQTMEMLGFLTAGATRSFTKGVRAGVLRAEKEELIELKFATRESLEEYAKKTGLQEAGEGLYKGAGVVAHAGEKIPAELEAAGFSRLAGEEGEQRLKQIGQEISEQQAKYAGEQAALRQEAAEKFTTRAETAVAETATSGCFLENTKILMADGTYKNIQDILTGEKITAFDIIKNKPVESEVTKTFERNANKYRIIEYEIIG